MILRLLKFDEQNKVIQEVSEGYIDGYRYGDRFLDGVYFRVVTKDGQLYKVEPTLRTQNHLDAYYSDGSKWSADILEDIEAQEFDWISSGERVNNDDQVFCCYSLEDLYEEDPDLKDYKFKGQNDHL